MQQRIMAYCWGFAILFTARAAAGGDSARRPPPPAWHVKAADLRFPLSVARQWTLPCDDYLADLAPVEMDNLKFDPVKKTAEVKDRTKKTGGSAVYAVRPHHRWITYSHRGGSSQVYADGKLIYKTHVWSRQTANARAPIPEGTEKIKLKFPHYLSAAGFTTGPRVAKAQVCLPGMNSADCRPVVYTTSGRRVGCKVVRAGDGEPMTVLFDCSGGERDYLLYPVEARHKIGPLKWTPPAGLIVETRYLKEYDASVETYEGFIKLWKRPERIAGRKLVDSPHVTRLPPFPSMDPRFSAPSGAPLVLSQCKGVMYVPNGGKVRFYLQFRCGGYLLIDGRIFIRAGGQDPKNREDEPWGRVKPGQGGKEITLSRGLHTYQLCVYGVDGRHHGAFSTFGTPWNHAPKFPLPVGTSVRAAESRDAGKRTLSVVWPDPFDAPNVLQALGSWPARNMVGWPLSARLSGGEQDVTFRWKFPGGREAEGKNVGHTFFEDGIYPVTVEALRSRDRSVLAGATVRIRVASSWVRGSKGYRYFNEELEQRAGEFDRAMRLDHLLSIHAWAVQNHRRPMQALASRAIDRRIDEVLKAKAGEPGYLLWLGKLLGVPPASAHDSAVKALKAAYRSMEPGSIRRRKAALALCDILTNVYDKPAEALKLIEEVAAQKDALALSGDWELAHDKGYYHDLRKINAVRVSGKLTWEEKIPELGFNERGVERPWLRKRLNLGSRDNSKPLFLDLGDMYSRGMIYFNNAPVCEPWQCVDGILTVPPGMLREGVNELLVHYQPAIREPEKILYTLSGPGQDRLDRTFRLAKAGAILAMDKIDEAGELLKQEVLKREVARAQPKTFVSGWHMLGPFARNACPSIGGKDMDLDKEWNGKKWRPVGDNSYRGAGVYLGTLVPEGADVFFYKKFNAEQAFDSEFTCANGGGQLWFTLNGKTVLGHVGRRGRWYGGPGIFPVNKGKNEIIVRVRGRDPRRAGNMVVSMTNPVSEAAEMSLASQLRKAKLWANDGEPDHADASYEFLRSILNRQPDQLLNMDVMETMVRALIGRHDHKRALVLSNRLLRRNPREVFERSLLWGQVQIRLGLRELDEARGIFKRLNRDFPYSEETLKAREAIIKWVVEEKRRKTTGKNDESVRAVVPRTDRAVPRSRRRRNGESSKGSRRRDR